MYASEFIKKIAGTEENPFSGFLVPSHFNETISRFSFLSTLTVHAQSCF